MKVIVHEDMCVGAGQCVLASPEVFDQNDDDGVVVLLQENPAEHLHESVREAASLCPAMAITIEE
ncbi:MAG: ferredoxin [Actinomycetota bacterium]|nr:MAG: ferredoxin [Actinomycetota bacterium]